MSFDATFRPEAEEDLLDAYRWYEQQSKGLGMEFLRSVDACISSIERTPEAYPVVYNNIRRALLRRFPYGLFYVVQENAITILACFHFRRNPRGWQAR